MSANRIYVHESIYENFVKRVTEAVSKINVGVYNKENVRMGPLINSKAVERVERLIENALENGAKVLFGGKRHELGANFFEPTVLRDVNQSMDIHNEEIFGPVAALYKFKSEEEVLEAANNVPYGLAAYFYTTNASRIFRVSEELEAGTIGINAPYAGSIYTPFGGWKESGIGLEGGPGIEEYLETKSTAIVL